MENEKLTIVGGTDGDEHGRPGHPPHEPTDEGRARVSVLAERGVGQRAIAAHIGVSINTLRKYYMRELVLADAKVQEMIGGAQLECALGHPAQFDEHGNIVRAEKLPDVRMLIFLGKARLGQRDGGPGQIDSNGMTHADDDGLEYNTAGLTDAERTDRIAALLDIAAARRARRASNGAGPLGSVSVKPATNGSGKPS